VTGLARTVFERMTPVFGAVCLLAGLAACAGGNAPARPETTASGTCNLAGSSNTLLSLARCCAQSLSSNSSCRAYDAERGYVIVKDNARTKPDAYLIIPVAAVTGIEDKQVFHSPVADFWQYGWEESTRFLRVPHRAVALAINSMAGRSEKQLHIHISCVRPDVASVLERDRRLGYDPSQPRQLRLKPENHVYRVVLARNLVRDDSPFQTVSEMPGARDAMGKQSIAVIGSRIPEMYYVLDTVAGPGNNGAAEELLDQTCASAPRE
jgi:CDP-diacylglycerol pyrophosphatase